MKQTFIFIFIIAILTSCSNDRQINLIFDNSTGLTDESPVLINGFQIGEIDRLKLLTNQKTFVTVDLTEEIEIPSDSRFRIEKNSLLGDASINVELGKSKTLISQHDTIHGIYSVEPTEIEKGIHKVIKNVIELTDSLKEENKNKKTVPNKS